MNTLGQMTQVHSRSMVHEKDLAKKKKVERCPLDHAAAKNIAKLRNVVGLSQSELARKVGISTSYVSMLERGERSPPLVTLWALAKALKVEPERLLRR